ncbi:phosphopantothenoylcysteine decarboxylase [Flavobacterium sp. UBA7682]|uniref:phosphopantothenoylcysteine decarboxylase n=1 Tax=Flavobacterium sp. UBA7682 TaxID=1946560 RepID=UPI0025B8B94D|nr:phosphopantothenoylcysteine decarboxylase [Flavobacterium sp. UBA7682]
MKNTLFKKKILITAGPTREYIDPVRFISNESTGKMGYAIAEALHQMGADVILVSGPVSINSSFPKNKIIQVISGNDMFTECEKYFKTIDIAIFCAAVADYTPIVTSKIKIKKIENNTSLELQKNRDIAYEFGKIKRNNQIAVGFALETNNIHENAIGKLKKKNFDLIVLNSPNKNEGFGFDTNKITIIDSELSLHSFPLKLKKEIANDIIFYIRNSNKLVTSENKLEQIVV